MITVPEAALLGFGAPIVLVGILSRMFQVESADGGVRLLFAGAATAFVALIAENYVWAWFNPILPPHWKWEIRAFLMIALVEELAKISLIYGQLPKTDAISWRQFAILSAWIGAGFAVAENGLYLWRHGPAVISMRILTATPFHIFNAVVAARMLWVGVGQDRHALVPAAVGLAVLLHGLYDYLIFTDWLGEGQFLFALLLTSSIAIGLLRRPDLPFRPSQTRRTTVGSG